MTGLANNLSASNSNRLRASVSLGASSSKEAVLSGLTSVQYDYTDPIPSSVLQQDPGKLKKLSQA